MHGVGQDEKSFVFEVLGPLDRAIVRGELPPVIIAAPDGSLYGRSSCLSAGSFFLNSDAGDFENFIMGDVWNFVHERFPIRPEREAHVLAGASMGGGAAYNLGFKYRDRVKVVFGFFPPLNTRWINCRNRYLRNFDPDCWGWREDYSRPHEVVGRFYGIVVVRMKQVVYPLYGRGPEVASRVSRENPIEMLDPYCIENGQLSMWVGYGGKDQFNIDAQVESFLYVARQRGLCLDVVYDPKGKHDAATALKMMPQLLDWLRPQLAPFAPPLWPCLP
jgi:S-formylglutathione hydrolase FrmB